MRLFLCLIIVISVILTFLSAAVCFRLQRKEDLSSAVLTPEYYSAVDSQVRNVVGRQCAVLGADEKTVAASLDSVRIKSMAEQLVVDGGHMLFSGSADEFALYPEEDFKDALSVTFGNDAEKISRSAKALADCVNRSVYMTDTAELNQELFNIYSRIHPFMNMFGKFGAFALATLALMLVYYISSKRSSLRKIYRMTGSVWIGTSFVFIPSLVAAAGKFTSRLPISDTGIRHIIKNIADYILDFIFPISLAVWAIATVALIVCIVKLVKRPYKHRHRRNFEEFRTDEDFEMPDGEL